MNAPERSPERDSAIVAMLKHVPQRGWTMDALRQGLRDTGADPADAELLFPGRVADLIESYIDLADRRMAEEAERRGLGALRTGARVRALVALRLELARPHKEAVRRATAILALPRNARLAARCTARTADAIWHAAGDRAADFNWYTKRALLAGVYGATLLYWLRDASVGDTGTLAFLDRRLADTARIGAWRKRAEGVLARCRPRREADAA